MKIINKKSVIAVVLAVIVLLVIGACNAGSVSASPRHISAKACAQQWKHQHSYKAAQCRRQGWIIEIDQVPMDNDFTVFKTAVLVVGPNGRVFKDTLGQLSNVR